MITALLLIFDPVPIWDRIVAANRKAISIFVVYLLPLLLLSSAAEGYGLVKWARPRGSVHRPATLTVHQAVAFEVAQVVLSLAVVFVSAKLIKSLGETFHGRNTYTQAFTLAVYGLSPVFLLRVAGAAPFVSPWVCWGVGIALSGAVLYHGLPRVMMPDPPQAFGLYVMTTLLLVIITGLACFLAVWFLDGRFTRLNGLLPDWMVLQ